ncbi:response regulator [Paenibacillus sp. HJGM_3]|uniref:response regulator n=1 Tax=Paenibacillus sp. HJGM_3 TaxID=3379816 RepID=UPI00385EE4B0
MSKGSAGFGEEPVTALLVDDEAHITRNLEKVIPWEQLGISLIGTATNGAKALELVDVQMPDLILSDIRMPVMDGLELLKELCDRGFDGEVVMLTGYQEFDYARTAIKYGAKDYILKPIDYEELEGVVTRAAGHIRLRKREKRNAEHKWKKLSTVAYEKLLLDVLMDYTSVLLLPEEDLPELADYTLLIVDLDDYSQLARYWNERERKLWNFAVRNVLQDALGDMVYSALQTREGEWCILLQQPPGEGAVADATLRRWGGELQQAVKLHTKLTVSVGCYPEPLRLEGLAQAYRKLQRALQLSLRKEAVLSYEEPATAERSELKLTLWAITDELVGALKQKDAARMEQAIAALNRELKAIPEHSHLRVEQMLHFLILHLLREMRDIGVLSGEHETAVWAQLDRSVNAKELLETVRQLAQQIMQAGMSRKPSELLMHAALDYIERHMAHDLCIDALADHLGISGSYFSLLFKQHTGETFVEYLKRQRLDAAKSMLLMTDKSVTQIGKAVGYAERRYFTKVFAKAEGMTPSEYREKSTAKDARL